MFCDILPQAQLNPEIEPLQVVLGHLKNLQLPVFYLVPEMFEPELGFYHHLFKHSYIILHLLAANGLTVFRVVLYCVVNYLAHTLH